ncbi:MAG: nucleotidyltransferase family protein [Gammaproteobacteria bacterium]|nr:nucleotidyltransferase family protein [Gammaproteobacteria bacterium]
MSKPVSAIVLAAGQSRRMGKQNKLLSLVNGRPMIEQVVAEIAHSTVDEIIVVTGHEYRAVRACLQTWPAPRLRTVFNPFYREGMASSIVCGLVAMKAKVKGALVCLGDMPWLVAGDYDRIITAFNASPPGSICVPLTRGQRGNPVLWDNAFFPQLKTLTGDTGARSLLAQHPEAWVKVPFSSEYILLDVDTPQALGP